MEIDYTNYSNLFFMALLKRAYKNANFKKLQIVHNICNKGILNIIATDEHYNYDLYEKEIELNNKTVPVFEISRYSEFSTYSDTKIYRKDNFDEIK